MHYEYKASLPLYDKVLNRVKKDKKELEKLWGNLKILIGELFGMIVNML